MTPDIDLRPIQQMLAEISTDEKLFIFCYDNDAFFKIYQELAKSDGKMQAIEGLVSYASQHHLLPVLIEFVQQHYPQLYEKYKPQIVPPSSAKPDSMRILVVDDEAGKAEQLGNLLKLNGFLAEIETHPHLVRARVQQEHYEIIFLDIIMPFFNFNGIDVLVDIKTFSPASEVILLTGHTGPGAIARVVDGMSLGASAFIELGPAISDQDYLDSIEKVVQQKGKHNLPGLLDALIQYLWDRLKRHQENHLLKGQDLEGLLKLIFESIEGFNNFKTIAFQQMDERLHFEFENHRQDRFWRRQGERLQVECRGWSGKKVGPEPFSNFHMRLNQTDDENLLGFFIGYSGFTDELRQQAATTRTTNGPHIVLIDPNDLAKLVRAENREKFLRELI